MSPLSSREFFEMPIADFIISSEKVAHVQMGNNAEHALLVLTKTGYSSIPVLDAKYRLHGMLSMRMITEPILGMNHIEYERLPDIKVDEIMDKNVATLNINDNFQRTLDLVINHAFLCVIDDEGTFVGIMTRRVILKQLKKHIYQLNS
ncbi:CBS domain-containing protein [Viridibacillus sp. YIM B01967]|uniref:CBS domain-containing protein n=1 Tax=Viridibacillus soli TaxID=2798301 RepID=A0ABS1H7I8_9BACL|nr:cyclic-di-AMP-binding protein CbpB [Viridibacillus soli]MBK3495371.1 CBS domain-containing protein [Viridibacillus soli]